MRPASQTNLPARVGNARLRHLVRVVNGMQGQPFVECPDPEGTTFQSGTA
jgi:hypothetical protein